jgi:predicted molibdopterin-dependent oxidoreductase YjgC
MRPPGDDLRAHRDPRGLQRGRPVDLTFDGRGVPAFDGETVGAALHAAGIVALRETRFGGRPRGLLCGIGACHDCLVTVDGRGPVRACLTPVADGMRVATHRPDAPTFDPATVDLRGGPDAGAVPDPVADGSA